jgi:hypothetical protein
MQIMKDICLELAERRKDVSAIEKISWYYRHWKETAEASKFGLMNKDQLPKSFIDDSSWDDWMSADPRNPQSQQAKDTKEFER